MFLVICADNGIWNSQHSFCEEYQKEDGGFVLTNVKTKTSTEVERILTKENTPKKYKRLIGMKIKSYGEYYLFHQKIVIINSDSIKSFVHFSDEQMKSSDPNLNTEWTNKTKEDVIVELNKKFDETIETYIEEARTNRWKRCGYLL